VALASVSSVARPVLLTDRRTDRRQLTTTVGGSSRPIIVLGALGPHIFSEQGPVYSKSGPDFSYKIVTRIQLFHGRTRTVYLYRCGITGR